MKAYRIGRVHLPWTNLEPPIRGGVHRKLNDDHNLDLDDLKTESIDLESPAADSATEDSAEVSSLFSRAGEPLSSDESELAEETDASGCRLRIKQGSTSRGEPAAAAADGAASLLTEKLSREAYTAAMEQKEIAEMIRSYPALDQETQDAIRVEYRALHKLIKDEGLYTCHYSAYGRECVRYAVIFSAFLLLLRFEWYIPSACCLGLFWVGNPRCDDMTLRVSRKLIFVFSFDLATSYVCRPRCRPPRHHRRLRHRYHHRRLCW